MIGREQRAKGGERRAKELTEVRIEDLRCLGLPTASCQLPTIGMIGRGRRAEGKDISLILGSKTHELALPIVNYLIRCKYLEIDSLN